MSNKKQEPGQDEMLDLVDENDQVFSNMFRSEVYEKKLFYQIRSIWLTIINSNGQLLVPRRSYEKKDLPGYLYGSVSGLVQSGETYEKALFREAAEELGIDINKLQYRFLYKLTPKNDNVFCFVKVYEAKLEDIPKDWNREDFCELFWLKPKDIVEKINNGDKCKSLLPIILKKFYHC